MCDSVVSVCHNGCACVGMGLIFFLYVRVMSFFDCPNVVLVSTRRTLRRVFDLVLMFSVCNLNVIPLSYVTPSVVTVLVHEMGEFLSVDVDCVLCSRFQGVFRMSVGF